MDYLYGVLSLLDLTIRAILSVPIFAVFMGGFVMAAMLGLFLLIKDASGGRGRRG